MSIAARIPWKPLAFLAPALVLFFCLATGGLFSGFFPDEVMNLYFYWIKPLPRHVADNLFFFLPSYRPAGSLFYLPLFHAFGFSPFPYRLVCFTLLTTNLAVVFFLAWRLSANLLTASLASTLFAYHAFLSDLYYSSATIYDLLCVFSCSSALLLYARWRSSARLTRLQLGVLSALQVLAFNSKEIAAVLPPALLAIELLYHRRPARDFRGPALAFLLVAVRVAGAATMLSNPAYRPSLESVAHSLSVYTGQFLYYLPDAPPAVTLTFVLFLAAGLLFPHPHIRFAALFSLLAPVPVLLIAPRSLYVMYLPMLGFSLLAGGLLALLMDPQSRSGWRSLPAAALLAATLAPLHLKYRPEAMLWIEAEQAKVHFLQSAFSRQLPSLPKGSRLFFESDPFDAGDWILDMFLRLHYRDRTLEIARRKRGEGAPRTLITPSP